MNHQSYRDVFVIANPALLPSGLYSESLAVGQLGIFSADPKKDQLSLNAPLFSANKVIQFFVGTPELAVANLSPTANDSDRSKPVKGKRILNFEGAKASRGQNQKIALGFDGIDVTKTLPAKCEQSYEIFVKLSGGPIDQAFHTEGKGYVRQYSVFSGCCDDCGNDCAAVSAEALADDFVKQFNNDPILSLGTLGATHGVQTPMGQQLGVAGGNRLAVAKKIIGAAAPTPAATSVQWNLAVADEGGDVALSRVQSQYPTLAVTVVSRAGGVTTYSLVEPQGGGTPADYTNAGTLTISDCPTCPAGYTLVPSDYIYRIVRQDAGTAAALTTLKSDYAIVNASGETASRLLYEAGSSTYMVISAIPINAPAGTLTDVITGFGKARNTCVLTTPTTVSWANVGNLYQYNKTYKITVEDSVCGTSRLADLQAAYPSLVITQVAVDPSLTAPCVHQFQTTVLSTAVPAGCPPDAPQWIAPQPFEGLKWVAVVAAVTTYPVGVVIESSFVDRVTNQCSFDYYDYDAEPIFIEISQHSQDYNDSPTTCTTEWAVTEIQAVKVPTGTGQRVRVEEAFFKGYDRKWRDLNPIVREIQGSNLIADPNKFYDQYTLSFEFDYHQSWFSEKFTDSYRAEFYFPEGTGKQFEAAMNAYIASIAIDIPPVVL